MSTRIESKESFRMKAPTGWERRQTPDANAVPYWVRVCTCGGDMSNPCRLCQSGEDVQRWVEPSEGD